MNIYARPTLITPILAEVSPNLALPLFYLHCNKDLAFRLVSGLSLVLFGFLFYHVILFSYIFSADEGLQWKC